MKSTMFDPSQLQIERNWRVLVWNTGTDHSEWTFRAVLVLVIESLMDGIESIWIQTKSIKHLLEMVNVSSRTVRSDFNNNRETTLLYKLLNLFHSLRKLQFAMATLFAWYWSGVYLQCENTCVDCYSIFTIRERSLVASKMLYECKLVRISLKSGSLVDEIM